MPMKGKKRFSGEIKNSGTNPAQLQPRSGERMQPAAQAVGVVREHV